MRKKFSGHDKRVTLQLARLSTAADQDPVFAAALNELPLLGWDVYKLSQEHQEILFAEFDSELEERIKAEFEADPSYVIDLGHAAGICPLCGHVGCRWLFKIVNKVNGNTIECGSECIVTHGLCVKGAETAEYARKALEATIRKAIKALKIEAWHKDMSFNPALFEALEQGLKAIYSEFDLPYQVRNSAWFKRCKDLPKLRKFYARTGWLNTEKRWAEWTRLVRFARKFDATTRKVMDYPLPHGYQPGAPVELKKAEPAPHEVISDGEVEAIEAVAAKAETPKVETLKVETLPQPAQQDLPFAAMATELVFG